MSITDFIDASLSSPSIWYLSCAVLSTGALLLIAIRQIRKRKKFLKHTETWHIGIYKFESEYDREDMMVKLWDEKEKYRKLYKSIDRKYTEIGWWFMIVYFLIADKVRNKKMVEVRHRKSGIEKVEIEGKTITITFNRPLKPVPNKQVYPPIDLATSETEVHNP